MSRLKLPVICMVVLSCAIASVAFSVQPSVAASGLCASREAHDAIIKSLNRLKGRDGRFVSSVSMKLIGTPTTLVNTKTKLVCQIHVAVAAGGRTQRVRGRLTYQRFSGGKTTANLDLGY